MKKPYLSIVLFAISWINIGYSQMITKTVSQQVRFSPETNEIPVEQAALLKVFIDITATMPDCKYLIQAQTDRLSVASYKKAADKRAQTVSDFLVQHQIPATSIQILETDQSLPQDDTDQAGLRQYKVIVQGSFTAPVSPLVTSAMVNRTPPKNDTLNPPPSGATVAFDTAFVFSKPKKKEDEPAIPVQDIYTKWDIEPQTFYLYPDRDTLLETIRGLFVYIPAFAFQTKEGANMGKEIAFTVKEYTKKSDMAIYYLASNNEKQRLNPSGIYRFEAFSEENPLSLKPDKQLHLMLPTVLATPKTQLHIGKRSESYQVDWERVSIGEGNFRTEIPEGWKISESWWRSQETETALNLQALRTKFRLNRSQGELLLNTLYAQRDFEQRRKKDKDALASIAPNTAFVFSIGSIQDIYLMGAEMPTQTETATLYVQYPQKHNAIFQLVSKTDKSVYYPAYQEAGNGMYAFKVSPKDEYTLLAIKYLSNKVLMSVLPIQLESPEMEISTIPFTEYQDKKEARKALRVLDY